MKTKGINKQQKNKIINGAEIEANFIRTPASTAA